jgi:hypothetical protein
MDYPKTCGQGLAEHSALTAKLAELIGSTAPVLELHMRALDLTDENSRKEYEAYRELAKSHQTVAAELEGIARRLAGYRDLPMGRHDPAVMASTDAAEAFRKFVAIEEELLALIQARLEQDRSLLLELEVSARPG